VVAEVVVLLEDVVEQVVVVQGVQDVLHNLVQKQEQQTLVVAEVVEVLLYQVVLM